VKIATISIAIAKNPPKVSSTTTSPENKIPCATCSLASWYAT